MSERNWSHSSLSTILGNPIEFFLSYKECIALAEEKSALAIGSAVHWGIEHDTENLDEYYKNPLEYTKDQLLAEAMLHGYLKEKDALFDQILTDKDGNKLKLLNEEHEVFITGKLNSYSHLDRPHNFLGIIDLLLLTDKGFIIIDYKTSTQTPDWDKYLDQIYRYIFLLKSEYPDIPIVKIGIINLKKTSIRQKKTENLDQYLNRMKLEYEIPDGEYINYHEYEPELLGENAINSYINNLSKMVDSAEAIEDSDSYYINYPALSGIYGKSAFWDIIYKTEDAYVLYKIKDTIIDEEGNGKIAYRMCVPIDMEVIDNPKVMNHYSKYLEELEKYLKDNDNDLDKFEEYLKNSYLTDDTLLCTYRELYKKTL